MAILPIQLFGQFSNPSPDPEGTDSRRDGANNIKALAASMQLTFPALNDTAVTRSGSQINNAPNKTGAEQITGAWTFTQNIALAGATRNIESEDGAFNLRTTGADPIRLQPQGSSVLVANPADVNITVPLRLNGTAQPTQVACATITVPASVGNAAPLSNQSGGGLGWSAVWTSATTITLTHSTGSTAYVLSAIANSQQQGLFVGKAANTATIGYQLDTFSTGQVIDIILMEP